MLQLFWNRTSSSSVWGADGLIFPRDISVGIVLSHRGALATPVAQRGAFFLSSTCSFAHAGYLRHISRDCPGTPAEGV